MAKLDRVYTMMVEYPFNDDKSTSVEVYKDKHSADLGELRFLRLMYKDNAASLKELRQRYKIHFATGQIPNHVVYSVRRVPVQVWE